MNLTPLLEWILLGLFDSQAAQDEPRKHSLLGVGWYDWSMK